MADRKGINGREVPGADLVATSSTTPPAGTGRAKRRRKGGRKHKRARASSDGAASDTTLVEAGASSAIGAASSGGVAGATGELSEDDGSGEVNAGSGGIIVGSSAVEAATTSADGTGDLLSFTSPGRSEHARTNDDSTPAPSPAKKSKPSNEPAKSSSSSAKDTPSESERYTPSEWSDSVVGDIVNRTTAEGTQDPIIHTSTALDPKTQLVTTWFNAQMSLPFRNLSVALRTKAITHLTHLKFPGEVDGASDWDKNIRLLLWRAVVRANFFWKDPTNGAETGKPKPVSRPTGIFENHFEAFVECASERLDRIGRDLPSPGYVENVENEVRSLFTKAIEADERVNLQHLAFLLLFEEEQRKNPLTLGDLQERIRRAFTESKVSFQGSVVVKAGPAPVKKEFAVHTVSVADGVWHEAIATLM